MEFTVLGEPVAQPRQRHSAVSIGGRVTVRNYTPTSAPVVPFKQAIAVECAKVCAKPLEGPVSLHIRAVFTRPKSRRTKGYPAHELLRTTKPDCDNIAKSVMDAMNGIAWIDDRQVVSLSVAKRETAMGGMPRLQVYFDAMKPIEECWPSVETNP